MTDSKLVFIDCETTGLDFSRHVPIEIAYMTLYMEKPKLLIPYSYDPSTASNSTVWVDADPKAMALNQFFNRYPTGIECSPHTEWFDFKDTINGATLVGANVAFDARMIDNLSNYYYHYRTLEMESYVAGCLRWSTIRSWKDTVAGVKKRINMWDWDPAHVDLLLTMPDHTAVQDCLSVRDVYRILNP